MPLQLGAWPGSSIGGVVHYVVVCTALVVQKVVFSNTAKAMKFCEKALKLYPTDAARALKRKVQQASGGSGQSGAAKPSQRVRA
eukprot:gene6558-31233_t